MGELFSADQVLIVSLALMMIYIIIAIMLRKRFFSLNWILTLSGFTVIYCLGYFHLLSSTEINEPDHLIHQKDFTHYLAMVNGPGEQRAKTTRYEVNVLYCKAPDQWKKSIGKVYLYLDKDAQFSYGDQLLIKGRPDEISPPQNPGEFDYKRFLSFKGIYHQHFIRGSTFRFVGNDPPNLLLAHGFKVRQWAARQLSASIDSARELNIALALVLGVKDGLDNEIRNAYAASGAMHVLAVSGLHVGIIYGIIVLLLGRVRRWKGGQFIFALVSVTVLWCYAMVTGFSPSVLRAVTMFTFIAVAAAYNRHTNIYNTLAASAFALLLYDPFLIMSVGFQLSFLAVLGIVYVQPKLYNLYIPNSSLVDKIWGITTVALAAQLATFPLGLLYFHQFPGLFFISNLIVIPGAFLILCLGLLVIAFSWFQVLADALGVALEWCIYIVNEIVFIIEAIPFGQISDVYISVFDAFLIIIIIVLTLLFFQLKKMAYIYMTLVLAIAFSANRIVSRNLSYQNKISIYRVSNHTAIDFLSNQYSYLYTDTLLRKDANKMDFHIKPTHLSANILSSTLVNDQETFLKSIYGIKAAQWKNRSLVIFDNKIAENLSFPTPVSADYVVFCKQFNKNLDWIKDNFNFDLLILDGSLSYYEANKLKEDAEALGLNYYSVYHDGAFEIIVK